jgi:hypothetical protein
MFDASRSLRRSRAGSCNRAVTRAGETEPLSDAVRSRSQAHGEPKSQRAHTMPYPSAAWGSTDTCRAPGWIGRGRPRTRRRSASWLRSRTRAATRRAAGPPNAVVPRRRKASASSLTSRARQAARRAIGTPRLRQAERRGRAAYTGRPTPRAPWPRILSRRASAPLLLRSRRRCRRKARPRQDA